MQFRADALNENTLNIDGNAGKSVALTTDGTTYTAKNESADTKGEDSAYTRGFHLAGVDIPYPTGNYVQKTGTTSLSDSAALCWVQRCTTEGKVAWVLSLVNGTCPAKTSVSCSKTDTPAGLTWQIKSENWGSAGQDLRGYCDFESNCDACCRRLCDLQITSIVGTSCSTAGATQQLSGVKEDTRLHDVEYDNGREIICYCSKYEVDLICQ